MPVSVNDLLGVDRRVVSRLVTGAAPAAIHASERFARPSRPEPASLITVFPFDRDASFPLSTRLLFGV
jgi:hypothetical protein